MHLQEGGNMSIVQTFGSPVQHNQSGANVVLLEVKSEEHSISIDAIFCRLWWAGGRGHHATAKTAFVDRLWLRRFGRLPSLREEAKSA